MSAEPVRIIELSMDELRSIIERSREGELSDEDREKLWSVIESYALLLGEIKDKEATIGRLRQLVFGAKTESKANVKRRTGKAPPGDGDAEPKKPRPKRKGHGRIPAEAYTGTERVAIPHATLEPGGVCSEACCAGTLYAYKPRLIVRIRGVAPFVSLRQARMNRDRNRHRLGSVAASAAWQGAGSDDGETPK
ncbi:MAG: hypothetical protein ACC662_02370 [Planctomycetota bacterium]